MNRRGPLIAAVASGVVILLAILLVVLPKISQVSKARADLSSARDQQQTLEAQLRALKDAQAAAPETKAELAKLDNLVPASPDLPDLIRTLSEVSDRSAVDAGSISPTAPVADPSGAFSTIITQINVTGGYFSLIDFLYRLETLPRAAKVTSVALTPASGTSGATGAPATGQVSLQMTVEFYTTDSTAGPGSVPEPSAATGTTGA